MPTITPLFADEADAWAADRGIATDVSLGELSDRVDVTETDIAALEAINSGTRLTALEAAEGTLDGRVTAAEADITGIQSDLAANTDFTAASNASYATNPTLIREFRRIDRDLGCISQEVNATADNYAALAPAFSYDSKVERILYVPPGRWRINSTLQISHRTGLKVLGFGVAGGPKAEVAYAHSGATPGANEEGGPESVLVWGGAAGGTMVEIYSENGLWDGVALQGQSHATNTNTIASNINYGSGAGTAIFIVGGEIDLTATPPYNRPGKWVFNNLNCRSVSRGVALGTIGLNHADHCHFKGQTSMRYVEDAFHVISNQAVDHLIDFLVGINVKRWFRFGAAGASGAAGGFHVLKMHFGGYRPTLVHICDEGMDFETGVVKVDCLTHEGSGLAASGFKWIDYGAITQASGADMGDADKSAFYGAADVVKTTRTKMHLVIDGGKLHSTVNGAARSFARLKGGMQLTLRNMAGLVEQMVEFDDVSAGTWGGIGSTILRPWLRMIDCEFVTTGGVHLLPENALYSSVGQDHGILWRGCTNDDGGDIKDGKIVDGSIAFDFATPEGDLFATLADFESRIAALEP